MRNFLLSTGKIGNFLFLFICTNLLQYTWSKYLHKGL
nr:MAG TPA: hypothetical protein [Caudoviricetes sp.]